MAAVRRAQAVGFPGLVPIVPELLGCIQDINWPIAPLVAGLLQQAGMALVPAMRDVLRGEDGMWKYWVIHEVLMHVDADVLTALKGDLQRLATHPTADDRDCEADLAAAEVLNPG